MVRSRLIRCFAISVLCASFVNASFAADKSPEVSSGPVVPGEWNSDFVACTNFAFQAGIPIVMIYGRALCSNCDKMAEAVCADEFIAWQSERKPVMCYVHQEVNDERTEYLASALSFAIAYAGVLYNGDSYPLVRVVWSRGAGNSVNVGFSGTTTYIPVKPASSKARDIAIAMVQSLEELIGDYSPVPFFPFGNTVGNRLEAQEGYTTSVAVPIRGTPRDADQTFALRAVFPGGGERSVEFTIPVGKSEPDILPTVDTSESTAGMVIRLEILADGNVVSSNALTVVSRGENNPKNPLWLGERDVTSLKPGEWTMDRDLALAKAAASGGSTLTLIGGSLWCPDCVNADAYLVDTDQFKEWATNNGIYCAAVDVPAFPKGATTCLLTYDPTTVSDRYVNATVPPQERVQSGAGYLSRKMIPMTGNGGTNATTILARNLNLTTNSVENGGLCRPEHLDAANTETGSWKTGVPCFVLQNAAGKISGRLYQFSNVSPTNTESVAAYVQRLDELRGLADDPTEEANKHWSTATADVCAIDARNGSVRSTISAIDTSDFWRLSNRTKWARMNFSVKGETGATDETNARLVLWRKSGAKAAKVAQIEGNLATGFALAGQEVAADPSVDYFIQLEALDGSGAFALEHKGNSVVNYALSVEAVENVGTIAFTKDGEQASEADAKKAGGTLRVYAPLARTGGATGATNVAVVIDAATTAFPDRYALVTDAVSWADGEMGQKSVAIDVFDDANADGTQALVLKVGESFFTLTISDNDKTNVGKLSFAGAVPAVAKKGVVIAEEGTVVTIDVARINGASGDVGCTVKATAGEFDGESELSWRSREAGARQVRLRLPMLADCLAGKAVVSFDSLKGGIKADSSAKSLTFQLVSQGCPRFETDAKTFVLARYCALSQDVAIVNLAEGAKASVKKLSGSVPSGVTVKLVDGVLRISGTPSRAAAYEAVYQVSQVLNRKTTPGLTIRLSFTVVDVAKLDPSDPGSNPSVAKSRTFGDQPVVDAVSKRLTGLLTKLTLPPTGKCSAKYKCAEGTISLSSKGWSSYDPASGTLGARLMTSKGAYAVEVTAFRDGKVEFVLEDSSFTEGVLVGEIADAWSADDPATDWLGYYTAAVGVPGEKSISGNVLASGNPYLTLKMQSESLAKKGTMSYAGVLPNGQSFSGSGTLVRDGLDTVILPVYYRSTKEFFTLAPQIKANAPKKAVECGDAILPWWTHTEKDAEGSYEIGYTRIFGSWYDANLDLLTTLDPEAKGHSLSASEIISVPVAITQKTVTLDKDAAKESAARLSFSKSTGLVSGSFKTNNSDDRLVTATYKGVILPDWGDGCPTCGEVPWAMGSFWLSDTLRYGVDGRERSLSVKRGGEVLIEKN